MCDYVYFQGTCQGSQWCLLLPVFDLVATEVIGVFFDQSFDLVATEVNGDYFDQSLIDNDRGHLKGIFTNL